MEKQIPKGTFDILPYGTDEIWRLSGVWQSLEKICREIALDYNYEEIRTPIYERLELFQRGVGDTTDIVTKEMFSFEDRAGRRLALRPEGTSSVMRSFLENQFAQIKKVHKLFYIGPMFRYERPQSGRYRQHHQFGVEVLGAEKPEMDAEVIDFLFQFYKRLGLKKLQVRLNTVGDLKSRNSFREALLSFLRPNYSKLSADSQSRFDKNPLRILDSKDPKDREIIKEAPSILEHLSDEAKEHFEAVQAILKDIEVPFVLDDKIVRGLDYYNKTVFEITSEDLGAQNTIGAGGRYDGLMKTFGGPDLPGVGFATGLERVLQVLISQKKEFEKRLGPFIYFIPIGIEAQKVCFSLVTKCRQNKIPADIDLFAKKIQNSLQYAAKEKVQYVAIVGESELKGKYVQLKNLETREQKEVDFEKLLPQLKDLYAL